MTEFPFSRNSNPELPDIYAAGEFESKLPLVDNEDPVIKNGFASCCLPGGYTQCHNLIQNTRSICPKYMEQYCAKSFDNNCKLYVAGMTTTNNKKSFLINVLKNKYCKLSPNSTCKQVCESVDPLNPSLDKVCEDVGQDTGFDPMRSVNIGTSSNVNISPTYRLESGCKKECDMKAMMDDPLYSVLHGIEESVVFTESPSSSETKSYKWYYLGVSIFIVGIIAYFMIRKR